MWLDQTHTAGVNAPAVSHILFKTNPLNKKVKSNNKLFKTLQNRNAVATVQQIPFTDITLTKYSLSWHSTSHVLPTISLVSMYIVYVIVHTAISCRFPLNVSPYQLHTAWSIAPHSVSHILLETVPNPWMENNRRIPLAHKHIILFTDDIYTLKYLHCLGIQHHISNTDSQDVMNQGFYRFCRFRTKTWDCKSPGILSTIGFLLQI